MIVEPLNDTNRAAALAYLRALPYRNALPLSNASQLRSRCDVLVALSNGYVRGVASTYHDLPPANLTFAVDHADVLRGLLEVLAERNQRLRQEHVFALLPRERLDQLSRYVQILTSTVELQMVVEPELLRPESSVPIQRLTKADLPQINQLAQAAGLTVWHDSALQLGPAFGAFVDGQLAALAATHFATPEVIEIGHIATHPAYRRRGLASACTVALAQAAFKLAPRVFLMVLEENTPALNMYRRLGFKPIERFYMVRCSL